MLRNFSFASRTHVEQEAQATRPSAKRGQLTTLLGPLRPTGGTVSERCCISVLQQYGQVPDRWVMMRLMQVRECNKTHDHRFFSYDTAAASSSSCTRYYRVLL